ncbi:MAG TPA: hypothetical protein VFG69_18145, partial [Nannocystaceae bacterium]|nr:hypothetical protein [Nannocystaceae bacterium]
VPFDRPPAPPEEVVPFEVERATAASRFRAWTTASWWRPKAIAQVAAELVPLWLPAWHVEADVEMHWAALERARTQNGWRPRAGTDTAGARTWIPASLGLSQAELGKLAPFADERRRAFGGEDRTIAFELPALSEAGARARALPIFEAMRNREIAAREGLSQCRGSARLHGVTSHLRVLPIWIGSFRYRDRAWRFVVNGQSGKVVGRAPLDRVKVGIAIVLGLVVAILVAAWLERHRPPPEPEHTAMHERP